MVFKVCLALTAWTALVLQGHIVLASAASQGISTGMALGNFLSYFTILTNALIAVSLTLGLLAPTAPVSWFFERPAVQTSITGCIISVSLIYHVALAKAWNPQGLQWWTNFLLHDLVPAAYVLHWLFFVPKGTLLWRQPLLWMIYPLVYLMFMLVRGSLTGFYPYPFVDVTWHGYTQVVRNLVFLVVGFALEFYVLVAVDKYMGKNFDAIFLRKSGA
jgi:hypothetical protein